MALAAHSPQEMTEKYAQPCQVSGRLDPKIELVPDKRRLTFAERQFPGLGELKNRIAKALGCEDKTSIYLAEIGFNDAIVWDV